MFNSKGFFGVVAATALLLGCNDVERVDPGIHGAGWETTTELSSADVSSSSNTVIAVSSSLMQSGSSSLLQNSSSSSSSSSLYSAQSSVSSSVSGSSSSADIVSSSSGGVSSCSSTPLSSSSTPGPLALASAWCLISGRCGTVEDKRDGKIYKTVKIGNRNWMAENLRFVTSRGSWCQDGDCERWGRHYDWAAALGQDHNCLTTSCLVAAGTQGACPELWRIPDAADWEDLTSFVRTQGVVDDYEGKHLMAQLVTDVNNWNLSLNNSGDPYGFSALPAGQYFAASQAYYHRNSITYFWSREQATGLDAQAQVRYFGTSVSSNAVINTAASKANGYSVRCVQ